MADATWYYRVGDQENGPVATDALCQMFAKKELPLETQVFSDAVKKWVPASSIRGFREAAPVATDPPPFATPFAPSPNDVSDTTLSYESPQPGQAHPWIRFFARSIDLSIACYLILAFVIMSGGTARTIGVVLYLGIPIIWPFVEALLLASFGTTPGKRSLGVDVETTGGAKPTYSQALARSFGVWFFGQGLGIPIVSQVTQILAYSKLTAQGETSWDRNNGLRVRHAPCGAGKVAGMLILIGLAGSALMMTAGFIGASRLPRQVAAVPLPPGGSPNATFSLQGLTRLSSDASRRSQLVGTWVISVTRNTSRGPLNLTNTLTLNEDGTYNQRVRATDGTGAAHPELRQDWSGTWAVEGDQFVETASNSSATSHPKGKWVYTLTLRNAASVTMRRESVPTSLAGADSHPYYRYQRAGAIAQVE